LAGDRDERLREIARVVVTRQPGPSGTPLKNARATEPAAGIADDPSRRLITPRPVITPSPHRPPDFISE
jgi:hypothetical protein